MQLHTKIAAFGLAALMIVVTPAMSDSGKANGGKSDNGAASSGKANNGAASDVKSGNGAASDVKSGNGAGKSAPGTTKAASVKSAAPTEAPSVDEPNHGALASELKGLNAVKANSNALENAAPNSQVGRIALYQDAALATIAVQNDLSQAAADLAALPVPERDLATIDSAIAALDPAAETYANDLAILTAERAAAQTFADAVAAVDLAAQAAAQAQSAEEAALLVASDGRVLSDEAIAYVRSSLGL